MFNLNNFLNKNNKILFLNGIKMDLWYFDDILNLIIKNY